jgi:hypothetical protein
VETPADSKFLNINKMKKLILLVMLGIGSLINNNAKAQISLNVNIGSQPLWGPIGYDHVDYYYLPDVDSYYNVPTRQFVYLNNGNWVFANSLPARYSNYNLYNGYKVVVNGERPYLNYNTDKVKYVKYKNWGGKQKAIKFSNDSKYYVVKGHPHGMPPGQAKKIMGNKGGKGHGNNGKGKH